MTYDELLRDIRNGETDREHEVAVVKLVDDLVNALRPFASIGIPDNWPAECVLTWHEADRYPPGSGKYAFIGYLHADAQGGPTIAAYQRAEALLEELGLKTAQKGA